MTWWRGIAFSVVVAFGVVYWMGSRLPVEHHAVATGRVGASQDKVWSLVSDTATQAQWRTGIWKIVPVPQEDSGRRCWLEEQVSMMLPLCVVKEIPESLHVVSTFGGGSFAGTWTYALAPLGPDATQVTITEDGMVHSPLRRFLGYYAMGKNTNVQVFLSDLQAEAVRKR